MTSLAMSDYVNSPLHVDHALTGIQLRVNRAKHQEAGIATLNSTYFQKKFDEIKVLKTTYFEAPTRENAAVLIEICEATQKLL